MQNKTLQRRIGFRARMQSAPHIINARRRKGRKKLCISKA